MSTDAENRAAELESVAYDTSDVHGYIEAARRVKNAAITVGAIALPILVIYFGWKALS